MLYWGTLDHIAVNNLIKTPSGLMLAPALRAHVAYVGRAERGARRRGPGATARAGHGAAVPLRGGRAGHGAAVGARRRCAPTGEIS